MKWLIALAANWIVLHSTSAAEPLADRWLYLQTNLQVAENVTKVEPILERAAKAGYNGVVLADLKLNILDRVPEHYFTNAQRFRNLCADRQLEVIPTVCGFGYSSPILAHDPNLAEALPVRQTPFVVHGDMAKLEGGSTLITGDLEDSRGHAFSGWSFELENRDLARSPDPDGHVGSPRERPSITRTTRAGHSGVPS